MSIQPWNTRFDTTFLKDSDHTCMGDLPLTTEHMDEFSGIYLSQHLQKFITLDELLVHERAGS